MFSLTSLYRLNPPLPPPPPHPPPLLFLSLISFSSSVPSQIFTLVPSIKQFIKDIIKEIIFVILSKFKYFRIKSESYQLSQQHLTKFSPHVLTHQTHPSKKDNYFQRESLVAYSVFKICFVAGKREFSRFGMLQEVAFKVELFDVSSAFHLLNIADEKGGSRIPSIKSKAVRTNKEDPLMILIQRFCTEASVVVVLPNKIVPVTTSSSDQSSLVAVNQLALNNKTNSTASFFHTWQKNWFLFYVCFAVTHVLLSKGFLYYAHTPGILKHVLKAYVSNFAPTPEIHPLFLHLVSIPSIVQSKVFSKGKRGQRLDHLLPRMVIIKNDINMLASGLVVCKLIRRRYAFQKSYGEHVLCQENFIYLYFVYVVVVESGSCSCSFNFPKIF